MFFLWEVGVAYVRINFFNNPVNLLKLYRKVKNSYLNFYFQVLSSINKNNQQSEKEIINLANKYQREITQYDDMMRNKYKLRRIVH